MKKRIWLHILFWAAQWFIYAYVYGRYDNRFDRTFISEGLQLPARIISTYLCFWLLKIAERKGNFPLVLLGIGFLTVGAGFVNRALKFFYLVPTWFPDYTIEFWNLSRFMVDIFDCILATSSALVIALIYRQQENRRREELLRSEKLTAELQALKSQIQPHFLFNTINNLYALALIRSEKTADVALQLANLLRYVLYDAAKPLVTVKQEITNLEDYISLEKLRFDSSRLQVETNIQVDNPDQLISPLLLLPLVENAFKHGASEKREGALVKLEIILKDNILNLRIENAKGLEAKKNEEGIGLKNLQRQLTLLYPGGHELEINETANTFTAHLQIEC